MDQPLLEEAFREPEFITDDEEPEIIEEPMSDDTYGLLHVGYLSDTVKIGSHEIRIRTLRIGEELNAALLAVKFKDTVEEGRALATAIVAASIISVDNKPLLGLGLGPGDDSIESKFDYILKNWYWESIRQIWDVYNDLIVRARDSADEIKKD